MSHNLFCQQAHQDAHQVSSPLRAFKYGSQEEGPRYHPTNHRPLSCACIFFVFISDVAFPINLLLLVPVVILCDLSRSDSSDSIDISLHHLVCQQNASVLISFAYLGGYRTLAQWEKRRSESGIELIAPPAGLPILAALVKNNAILKAKIRK